MAEAVASRAGIHEFFGLGLIRNWTSNSFSCPFLNWNQIRDFCCA